MPDHEHKMMQRSFLLLVCAVSLTGCITVKIDPTKPIEVHATVDVVVKVDQALDDFFGDLDRKSATIQPATTP